MKTVLATCFFPAFCPQFSGGEKRLFEFYFALSKYYDIRLITLGYPTRYEEIHHNPHFTEYRIPKPHNLGDFYSKLNNLGAEGDLCHVVSKQLGNSYSDLKSKFEQLAVRADVIIHEFPSGFSIDNLKKFPNKPRIYNSHNFEYGLAQDILTDQSADNVVLETVYKAERDLINSSDAVFAMSENEIAAFELVYGASESKLHHIPMGYLNSNVQTLESYGETPGCSDNHANCALKIVFIGSAHIPNIKAAKALIDLARTRDDISVNIAGSICNELNDVPSNVFCHGIISVEKKSQLYLESNMFVNLIDEGAGVNVKLIEAMSYGLMIVSTKFGTRGAITEDYPVHFVEDIEQLASNLDNIKNDLHLYNRVELARKVDLRHGYDVISSKVDRVIKHLLSGSNNASTRSKERSLNLFLNDYSPGNGAFGGAKRIDRLTGADRKSKNVLLCFSGNKSLKVEVKSNYTEIQIPKTKSHTSLEQAVDEGKWISSADMVSMLFCAETPAMVRLFKRLLPLTNNLVFCHCYMAPMLELIPEKLRNTINVIYDSHNIEGPLKEKLFSEVDFPKSNILVRATKSIEEKLIQEVDKIIVVSTNDSDYLKATSPKLLDISVINNGTDINELCLIDDSNEQLTDLIFLGSAHPPNVEGIKWFIGHVMPKLTGFRLNLIGTICDAIDCEDSDVIKHGVVSEGSKASLLKVRAIAVNPVFSGGGSSLKVADYLASGLPTVTTDFGIRGFELKNGKNVLISELSNFADNIRLLANNVTLFNKIRVNGYNWASQNLSWSSLCSDYIRQFNSPSSDVILDNDPKELLVVTYRYSEPNFGGGELYLSKILEELSTEYDVSIDVICPDKYHFQEHSGYISHFSDFPKELHTALAPNFRNLTYFDVDERDQEKLERFAVNIEKEKVRSSNQVLEYMETMCDVPFLAGGWHELESGGFRWSNGLGKIVLPGNYKQLELALYSPEETEVSISSMGILITTIIVNGLVNSTITLPEGNDTNTHIVEVKSSSHVSDDGRTLGVILSKIDMYDGYEYVELPIEYDRHFALNSISPALKSKIFRSVAMSRDEEINEQFEFVRGLNSVELIEHLREVAGRYDAVLLHGIQFGLVYDAARELNEMGVKFHSLPHIHPDDEFYHWSPMYEVIESAENVFCFESNLQKEFTSTVAKSYSVVPGGGVSPDEKILGDNEKWERLQNQYSIKDKYFLVLGRKAQSKNYKMITSAFSNSRLSSNCSLVLIGPDEDLEPVLGDSIVYLGPRDRDEVLAALSGAAALVNMSSSESFGMVLAEAWLMKTPVIANKRCEAFDDLVIDGENGIFVEDELGISAAMEFVLNNPKIASEMGKKGCSMVNDRFTWKSISKRYYEGFFC